MTDSTVGRVTEWLVEGYQLNTGILLRTEICDRMQAGNDNLLPLWSNLVH